jgi:hypothetical protein
MASRKHAGKMTSPDPDPKPVPEPPCAAAPRCDPVPMTQSTYATLDEEAYITMLAVMGYFD